MKTAVYKSFIPPKLRDAILDRVHNYYESNLRETNKVDFEENHSYDSRRNSDERTNYPQGTRRVIDQDSISSSADAASTSDTSNASTQSKPRRKLISRRDANSSESEEECFDLASISVKENSDQILLEPFHQDLSLQKKRTTSTTSISLQERGDLASIASKENTTPILLEPFHQDLSIPKKRTISNTSNLMQERRGEIPRSTPTSSTMHNESSEGESGTTLPEQWKRSRMRRQANNRNRANDRRNRVTHHATQSTHPNDGNIPSSININQPHERKMRPIPLTSLEKAAIKAQDAIGLDRFIRGRTAKEFAPVIQQYYTNNKIRSFFTPLVKFDKQMQFCLSSIRLEKLLF